MLCAACSHENRPGRRFCGRCGAQLSLACPSCGAENDPGDRFCGSCGTDLQTAATQTAAAAPSVAERRMVSVLFADLVGFTPLAESRDPEEVRELLAGYFEAARDVIAGHGGTLEKFIGDAVVAVWGAPVAQEDDAERAVRAALELVDAVAVLGRTTGFELAVRAAVSTGEAAVTVGAEGHGMVAGDMVNTTARMQAAAEPGSVLVDTTTDRMITTAIATAEAGSFELKGKSAPITLHTALRVLANRRGEGRYAGVEPPFVGRERELRLVKDLFQATAADGRAHLVLVSGAAGLGKTRLSWEFEKYVDGLAADVFWHRGRCLSYGDGVAFWALAEMVRGRARIVEDEPAEGARGKLAAMLGEHVPDDRERTWVEPALRHLLGLEELDGADRSRLFSAWRLFFERLTERGTGVLVFEDMQWADQALLDFVEYLMEWSRGHRLFVLALTRPELTERRPGWASSRGLTALPLDPLPEAVMRDLVGGMVPGLAADVVERIARHADGTPLYAVETVRMLLDRGLLRRSGDTFEPTGELDQLDIPESLQALVAARLDALPADERSALQTAAVLGKTFTLAGLATVSQRSPEDLVPLLDELTRKDILQVQTDPFSPERGQYGFVQATLRTVAYERISRRERKALHLAVADHLGEVEDSGDLSEVVAAHLFDAVRLEPNDADAEALRERARTTLLTAADRAQSLGAPDESLRLVERAIELTQPDDHAPLLERAGRLACVANRIDEGDELLRRALELYEAQGDNHAAARVRCGIGETLFLAGRTDEAREVLERAYGVLAGDTPDADLALLASQVGRMQMLTGQGEAAEPALDHALRIGEELGLPGVISSSLNTKGLILLGVPGRTEEGRSLLWGALRVALAAGADQAILRAYFNLSFDRECADDLEAGVKLDREALALARRLGDRQWETSNLLHLMIRLFNTVSWDEVLDLSERMDWRAEDSAYSRSTLGIVAVIHANRGDSAKADMAFGEARLTATAADPQARSLWGLLTALRAAADDDDRRMMEAARVGAELTDVLGPVHDMARSSSIMYAVAAARLGERAVAQEFVARADALPTVHRTPRYVAGAHRVRGLLGIDAATEYAAAERILTATGHAWELAETLRDHARSLVREGLTDEAAPIIDRAAAIYERAGATARLAELDSLIRPRRAGAAGNR